jgi:hypothetical protein
MTFFDKYSFKQKKYAALILGILLFAASYKRAFSTTIETRKAKQELIQKINDAKFAVSGIKQANKNLKELNKLIGKENVTIEKVQQGFLTFFTRKSKGLSIFQIDEVLRFKHPDFSILTHRIEIKGNFLDALSFIYTLEKEFDLAKLINVDFLYKKLNSEEQASMYTIILLQNYER